MKQKQIKKAFSYAIPSFLFLRTTENSFKQYNRTSSEKKAQKISLQANVYRTEKMWRKWEKTSRSQLIRLISSEGDVIYTVHAIHTNERSLIST